MPKASARKYLYYPLMTAITQPNPTLIEATSRGVPLFEPDVEPARISAVAHAPEAPIFKCDARSDSLGRH